MSVVGIVGLGFVGGALNYSFTQKQITQVLYDKYKQGGIGHIDDLLKADIVFLCLPTLYNEELKQYDKTAIHEVCDYLSQAKYQGSVVIKSTIEPGTTAELQQQYKLNLLHNPEFLTAKTANEDFHNQKHIVIGGSTDEHINKLKQFYETHYPTATVSTCSTVESESMKLFVNNFYAMKIQIFNEFYFLTEKLGADYQKIVKLMLMNGWIAPHHVNVPGPDGKFSYGGMCFPKDTQALLQVMKNHQTPSAVLEATIQERNQMRK